MNIARAAQRARLRIIIPALAVAIAALIVPLSQIASAHTATRAAAGGGPMISDPGVVTSVILQAARATT